MNYLAKLLKTTFRPSNIGMLFYMLINLLLLLGPLWLITVACGLPTVATAIFLFLVAIAYFAVVISCGEVILRLLFGGSRIVLGETSSPVSLAFMEAYRDAVGQDPELSKNIKLYICRENYPDAFALGRNTILLSEPATRLSQNDLKILLLEKFAQISDNDSDRIQLLISGNLIFVIFVFLVKIAVYVSVAIIGIIVALVRFVLSLFLRMRSGGSGMFAANAYLNICRMISDTLERFLTFIFNLFIRLALISIRSSYYINDEFVCRCGYSQDLSYFLEFVAADVTGFTSTLGTISAAKPSRLARVSRIQQQSSPVGSVSTGFTPVPYTNPPRIENQQPSDNRRMRVINKSYDDDQRNSPQNRSESDSQRSRSRFRVINRH